MNRRTSVLVWILVFLPLAVLVGLLWRAHVLRERAADEEAQRNATLDEARLLTAQQIEEKRAESGLLVTPRPWPGVQRLVIMERMSTKQPPKGPFAPKPLIPDPIEVSIRADVAPEFLRLLTTDQDAAAPGAAWSHAIADLRADTIPAWARGRDLDKMPPLVGAFLAATDMEETDGEGRRHDMLHLDLTGYHGGRDFRLSVLTASVFNDEEDGFEHRRVDLDERWPDLIGCDREKWRKASSLAKLQEVVESIGVDGLLEHSQAAQLPGDWPRALPAPATWASTYLGVRRKLLGTRMVAFGDGLIPCWEVAWVHSLSPLQGREPVGVDRLFVCPGGVGPGSGYVLWWTCYPSEDAAAELWDDPTVLFSEMPSNGIKRMQAARLICVPADEVLWHAGDEPDAGWKAWRLGPPEQDPALVE